MKHLYESVLNLIKTYGFEKLYNLFDDEDSKFYYDFLSSNLVLSFYFPIYDLSKNEFFKREAFLDLSFDIQGVDLEFPLYYSMIKNDQDRLKFIDSYLSRMKSEINEGFLKSYLVDFENIEKFYRFSYFFENDLNSYLNDHNIEQLLNLSSKSFEDFLGFSFLNRILISKKQAINKRFLDFDFENQYPNYDEFLRYMIFLTNNFSSYNLYLFRDINKILRFYNQNFSNFNPVSIGRLEEILFKKILDKNKKIIYF